ncbi:MAG: guanylate kinase [Synergistaceae bacterium]|jgi:guanylate kinase|nr:guanylate kinase [Synergistaceae bacterium]
MNSRGRLFIMSGPAGTGKGTLRKILFEEIPDFVYSISCTTRKIRPDETEGVDYHFVSKDEFGRMVAEDEFLEWAEVHGSYYGTRRRDVEAFLDEGKDVLLEIDVQGALQVKSREPDVVTIFISPPSLDELENRLEDRGTESPEQLAVRLRNAVMEMRHAREYDYIVVNDKIGRAADELSGIIEKYRSRRKAAGVGSGRGNE